jgi:hypothetical protein
LTQDEPTALPQDPEEGNAALALRESRELQKVPPARAPAPPAKTAAVPVGVDFGPAAELMSPLQEAIEERLPGATALSNQLRGTPPPQVTWGLATVALAAGVGWIYERRQRLERERGADSALWPSVRPNAAAKVSRRPVEDTVRNSGPSDEGLPSIQVFAISETTSRREATLVDLHVLLGNLIKLRAKRQLTAAADLVEGHLVDFRYTSPWVFLELRELYQQLDQREEWELARDAFRARFGQNAPRWSAASTASDELADDAQLGKELARKWPRREARMFILRWMLGDAASRQKNFGPPQLTLGIYRDMMLLDAVLDEVMTTAPRAEPAPVTA